MKVDFYTKASLTVIAFCLSYFVVKDISIVPDVRAQSRGVVDVNIVQVAGAQINAVNNRIDSYDAFLPVKVKQ